MADALFCAAHQVPATEFCLCGPNPVYLCVTCIPTHSDKHSHDVFPIASLELYSALGNDKAELKRRYEIVEKCRRFFNSARVRETTAYVEATALEVETVKTYQTWLANNHRYFESLMEVLRKDNAVGNIQPPLSPLSQVLADRTQSFNESDVRIFSSVPEKESLELLNQHFKKVLAAIPTIEQRQYNAEVRRAFFNLTEVVQQSPVLGDPKLYEVTQGQIRVFDVGTCDWQQPIPFPQNQVGYGSTVNIAPNTVFICCCSQLTGSGTCHVGKLTFLLRDDGSIEELPHMLIARRFPGLTWDSARKAVYVFAGYGEGMIRLRSSEQFQSQEWLSLPDMDKELMYPCTPCWHSGLVYLSAGSDRVDFYDPRSNRFVFQMFTQDVKGYVAVEEGGVLIIISKHHFYKLHQDKITTESHNWFREVSNVMAQPVVSNGIFYLLGTWGVTSIDLATGEEKYIKTKH